MKQLTFITGNSGKLAEVQAFLPFVQGKQIDLPEIQSVDTKEIVRAKLAAAVQMCDGPVIVDDTALFLECMAKRKEGPQNAEFILSSASRVSKGRAGLPGPLIKWFLKTVGNTGLADIACKLGKTKACAQTIIGYAQDKDTFHFFEGVTLGTVVKPQGTAGFGWDHIFVPDRFEQTFAKMGVEKKNKISPRAQAAQKLRDFLLRS